MAGPDRGQDAGRDLIVKETRSGIGGSTEVRWLVSCKHKAHSGASVTLTDEADIVDRVTAHGCSGFVGVYSTLPASSVTRKLNDLNRERSISHLIYDAERIEGELLRSPDGILLAERFFTDSFARWKRENPGPADLLLEPVSLFCDVCNKDLLEPPSGIITLWRNHEVEPTRYEAIHWHCKQACDFAIEQRYADKPWVSGWEDIPDVCIPEVYLKWIMTLMNEPRFGVSYSDEAFERIKEFMIALFPLIARGGTEEGRSRIRGLLRLPSEIGGLG